MHVGTALRAFAHPTFLKLEFVMAVLVTAIHALLALQESPAQGRA
jgi:hypothetical protein